MLGEEMGVGRTQIMNILKRKREILDDINIDIVPLDIQNNNI
jgi:hypothetical protein